MKINGTKINEFEASAVRENFGTSLLIDPMKVWALPKNKGHMKEELLNSDEYFKLVKKDGYWYQYEKNSEGGSGMYSRTVSKKTGFYLDKSGNIPHIADVLDKKLPKGTILIGETYIPGKTSSDVTTIMGCLAPKAVARQEEDESKRMHYYVHDILMYNGKLLLEVDNYVRYQILKKVFNECQLLDSYIELAEEVKTDGVKALNDLLNKGEEGLVLKKKVGIYHPAAKPAWETIKFKRTTADMDVVCLGFEPPTKLYTGSEVESWKYWADNLNHIYSEKADGRVPVTKAFANNWIGALKIGVYDEGEMIQLGTVSSGLTETLLRVIESDPDTFLNKPLVVGAMEVNEEEKTLRHPYINSKKGYCGFRDDIDIEDCTWEKILIAEM